MGRGLLYPTLPWCLALPCQHTTAGGSSEHHSQSLPPGQIWPITEGSAWASRVAQQVKNPPAMQETWVQSLGWEDLEKGKDTHSSILAWRIPHCIIHGVTRSRTHLSNFHFQGFCLGSAETLQSPHTSIQLTSVESDPQPPENSGQLPPGQLMAGPQFNSTRHQSGPIHQDSLITLSTGGLSGLRSSLRAPQFGLWTETLPNSLHLGVFPKQRQHSPFHVCVSFWHQPS